MVIYNHLALGILAETRKEKRNFSYRLVGTIQKLKILHGAEMC